MHKSDKWRELMLQEAEDEIIIPLRESDDGEDDDWEETPEKKKAVVIHPKAYYDNLARKRNKRNKVAAKSRKINRGKK